MIKYYQTDTSATGSFKVFDEILRNDYPDTTVLYEIPNRAIYRVPSITNLDIRASGTGSYLYITLGEFNGTSDLKPGFLEIADVAGSIAKTNFVSGPNFLYFDGFKTYPNVGFLAKTKKGNYVLQNFLSRSISSGNYIHKVTDLNIPAKPLLFNNAGMTENKELIQQNLMVIGPNFYDIIENMYNVTAAPETGVLMGGAYLSPTYLLNGDERRDVQTSICMYID